MRPNLGRINSLWLQIVFIEQWRSKEIRNRNIQALAQLMDHTQLHRRIGAVDDIANGGLGHTTFHIKLILCHIPLPQQFCQSLTDRFI